MRRLPARLRRHGVSIVVTVVLGVAWWGSIFAADSLFVNLPGLGRSFTVGQSHGMVGFGSQGRGTIVDFGCGGPVFGSMSGPICLWRNPHGPSRRRFEIPLPVFCEVQANYWSFGVSYWLLGGGYWLGRRLWLSRRAKKLSLEMATLPQ